MAWRQNFVALCILINHLFYFVTAQSSSTYWVNNIARQGFPPFGNHSYPVFRNVMSYGAKGDGVTDDTKAINNAISYPGTRCEGGNAANGSFCGSQTITPALVYFPPGTYLVTSEIILVYFTQAVGDAVNPPTIKVAPNFKYTIGLAVFDNDIYISGGYGNEWYGNQNNFYRQVRNFIFDMTAAPNGTIGLHWQVGQATSLQNLVFNMVPNPTVSAASSKQTGIFMENGSGGFMSDLTFNGGAMGAYLGNQQFTSRNMLFNQVGTAIFINFDWEWTFTQITITNCGVGIDLTKGGFTNQLTGSVVVLDSTISAQYGILTPYTPGYSSPPSGGTLVLEEVDFTGSTTAIAVSGGTQARVILGGGRYVQLFAQGNAWTTAGNSNNGQFFNGTACVYANSTQTAYTAQETTIQQLLAPVPRPASLLDANGRYFARSKPQYQTYPASAFMSAKTFGLAGDGVTDDTAKMQQFFNSINPASQIAYFDHGAYVVSSTINIPANITITGECWPMIMATGTFFGDQTNPQPMWKVGNPGDVGAVEMSDIIFEALGPVPGAIMVEWNLAASGEGTAGMWDCHWRMGGSAGTHLQSNTCLKQPAITTTQSSTQACQASFVLLHVTPQGNGYFENTWGWVADHDLDLGNRDQIDIYNGRGALIESANGPVWMYGTAFEHSTLYNYQFSHTSNVYAGHIQTETAYFQGNPNALTPFTPNSSWTDPTFANCNANNCARTWGNRIINSSQIFIYSSGHYNFFDNWDGTTCTATSSCQENMVDISNSSDIYLWALNTAGSQYLVQYEETSVVPFSVNKAGYCDTVVLFEVASSQ